MLTMTPCGVGQRRGVDVTQPGVEQLGPKAFERHDLGAHPERGLAREVGHARRTLLGAAWLQRVSPRVVEEVLPRAARPPLAEAPELVAQVLRSGTVDPADHLVLVRTRETAEEVRQGVGVRGDEVQRAVGDTQIGEHPLHRRPPASCDPRVADRAAPEHPDAQVERGVAHLRERRAQRVEQPVPVVLGAAERPGTRRRVGICVDMRRGDQQPVQLVPLELVRDERRDEVVEVRAAREQDCERPASSANHRRRLAGASRCLPLDDPHPGARELHRLLSEDDASRGVDVGRQAAAGVDERAEVDVVGRGQAVQARSHRAVNRLEHAQPRLTRGPQQRRVRPVVELDVVGRRPGVAIGRGCGTDVRDAHRTRSGGRAERHPTGRSPRSDVHRVWPTRDRGAVVQAGEAPVSDRSTRRRSPACSPRLDHDAPASTAAGGRSTPAERGRGLARHVREERGEVGRVAEADATADRGDREIGVGEQATGLERDPAVDDLLGGLACGGDRGPAEGAWRVARAPGRSGRRRARWRTRARGARGSARGDRQARGSGRPGCRASG